MGFDLTCGDDHIYVSYNWGNDKCSFTNYFYVRRCLIDLTVHDAVQHLNYAISKLNEKGYTGTNFVYSCIWGHIFMGDHFHQAAWITEGFPPPPQIEVDGKLEPIPTWQIFRAEITDPIVIETATKLMEQAESNTNKTIKEQILELKMWVDITMHDTFLNILMRIRDTLMKHSPDEHIYDDDEESEYETTNPYTEKEHAEAHRICDEYLTVEEKRKYFQSLLDVAEI